jgi:hypothetical protein
MEAIQSIKLLEVFGLIAKPRFILGTTYTLSLAFFESAVFPALDRSLHHRLAAQSAGVRQTGFHFP